MSEEQQAQDPWREVGQQFQALGESLAQAFRAAWEDEGNRQHLQEMQAGLSKMVDEIGAAIQEASESPEGQRVREEAEKAARSAHGAGKEAWQEARPHVVSALRKANAELQKVINNLEGTKDT